MKVNNKRTLLSAAVAASLLGVSFGVQAGKVGSEAAYTATTTYTYANEATVAYELTTINDVRIDEAGAYYLGASTTSVGTGPINRVQYEPSYGMNEGDIITITFSNALYIGENANLVTTSGTLIATNLGAVDKTNGVSTLTLRAVDLSSVDTTTAVMRLCVESDCATTPTAPAYLLIPQGISAGSKVGVSVSVEAQVVGEIGAAAASGTLFDVAKQLSVSVETKATSLADVSAVDGSGSPAPRTKFVDEGAAASDIFTADVDTSSNESRATVGIVNSTPEYPYVFSGDSLILTFTSSTGNADVLDQTISTSPNLNSSIIVATGGPASAGFGLDASDIANGVLSYTFTDSSDITLAAAIGLNFDILLTVDGETAIDERSWLMNATLEFGAEGSVNYATDITAFSWSSNGTVLTAPFFTLVEGYVPRLYLQNNGDSGVDYVLEILTDATANPGISFISGNSTESGTIPAKESLLLKMTDLVTGQRGGLIITLAGACNTLSGVFQQRYSLTGDFTHYNLSPTKACTPDLGN